MCPTSTRTAKKVGKGVHLQQDVTQAEIEALEEKVRWKGKLREEGEMAMT